MYRETWAEIRLDRIRHNIKKLQQRSGKSFFAVIKANGYGCGDEALARSAVECSASYLAVSCIEEALFLRDRGVEIPLLVFAPVPLEAEVLSLCKERNITITASSPSWVHALSGEAIRGVKVHIKFDSGMHRIGFDCVRELSEGVGRLRQMGADLEGIYTHFAASDEEELSYCDAQLQRFEEAIGVLGYPFRWIHCSNTDGALRVHEGITNAVRCGIGMLGFSSHPFGLLPAVNLYSKIVEVKRIKKGESVGYSRSYIASEDEWIGVLPIGYGDGWLRKNSGRSCFTQGGECEFVGRICMDMSMIRLPGPLPVGTKVELIGENMPLERVAKELETIPYEVITLLGNRIMRRYVKE